MSIAIDDAKAILASATQQGLRALSEYDSKRVLAAYGAPVVPETLARDSADAVRAAKDLGFPVAVKACSPVLMHKSELGLVALNLENAAAVEAACREIDTASAGTALDGYLVQRMVKGRREIIVGGMRDKLFGPCVMLGLGGTLVEALGDVAFRLAPVDERDALEMLNELRARKMFEAFRGEPAVDRAALARVLVAVGRILIEHPEVSQVDVNPLILDGANPVAVDALITLDSTIVAQASCLHYTQAVDDPQSRQDACATTDDEFSQRTVSQLKMRYHALFEPSSVAIVGASSSPLKWGFRILFNTVMGGYKGALYAVNPSHKKILDVDCYPSLSAIPEPLDLAFIVLPPKLVIDAVRECARCGVRAVVVITAGFSELGDAETIEAEREIAQIARESGLLLVGPNCAGIASPNPESLYSGMIYRFPSGGGLSVVSQSGNVGMTVLTWAQLHQVGIARFVSSGNEAATRSEDYLRFCAHDSKTKAILAYIEGTRDGRRFFDALRDGALKKPVVVTKGGRSEAGQKAAASHTGSLAGATTLFESACRQAGANVVDDIYQAMELTSAFVNQPLPKGRRVVIVSEGGGWGVMGADACAAAGLEVISLPEDIFKELDGFMPSWWSRGNPIDLVASNDRSLMSRAIETVLKCPVVDAVLVLGIGYMSSRSTQLRSSKEMEELGLTKLIEAATNMELHDVRKITGLIDLYEKPIIAASDTVMLAYGPVPNEAIHEMERLGVYAYASPINAAKTLAHMVERYEFVNRLPRGGVRK